MRQLINWIKWCWKFKKIMRWNVGLVLYDFELTEEEYNYPSTQQETEEVAGELGFDINNGDNK